MEEEAPGGSLAETTAGLNTSEFADPITDLGAGDRIRLPGPKGLLPGVMMRLTEIFSVRPSLRPLGWVLLCTQLPNLLILGLKNTGGRQPPWVPTYALRGLVFGLMVGILWHFKSRNRLGGVHWKSHHWALGLVLGLAWGWATIRFGGGAQSIGGIPRPSHGSWVDAGLVVFTVGIALPFFEELLFRGIAIQELGAIRQNHAFLVLGSAALFLLVHLGYGMGLANMIQVFMAGLALAWLALWSKNLWPSIFLHIGYNICLVVAFLSIRH